MGRYLGGVIRSSPINVNTTKASGMFNTVDVYRFISQGTWPISSFEVYLVLTE